MEHTYTLNVQGFIHPSYMRNRTARVVGVARPRTLELEGMTLRLLDGEPDLPIGSQVKVWLDRWFHCETLEYIEHKQAEADRKAAAKQAHEDSVKQRAVEQYVTYTENLIAQSPTVAVLKEHLDTLYADRKQQHLIYKRHWYATDPAVKQKSNDAYTFVDNINTAIQRLSEYVFEQLKAQGCQAKTAYAYSPREGGREGFFAPGADHYQLLSPVTVGRLKRVAGDALCKPAKKFWGLDGYDDKYTVTCKTCLYKMLSLLKRQHS